MKKIGLFFILLLLTFTLARSENLDQTETVCTIAATNTACIMRNGVSVPGDFPHVKVRVLKNPAEGYLFVNNWGGYPYTMILENDGTPIWYLRGNNEDDFRRDFKIQENGLLTMRVTDAAGYSFGAGFIALDRNYTLVDSFYATKGFHTDEHELQVLENGHYLLFGLRTLHVDMSQIVPGGHSDASIQETGIQEFDNHRKLIFHWRAWDHFHPKDMIGFSPDDQPTDKSFRFTHMNSIDIDDDGHIILSSKRISEITKIDRETGDIIWRLGGANNQFKFINDPLNGFSNQHSVCALGKGHYTVFDNGCLHQPPVTRILEYELDTENMTATLVWQFITKPATYAYHMGNAQRLSNGNTLINWAVEKLPKAMEVNPDGTIVYEMNFINAAKSYRTFRFPWQGKAKQPYLIVEPVTDNITLIMNQFGDPDVAYFRIYASTHPNPVTVIDTSRTTLKRLRALTNNQTWYFRVTSVNRDGKESHFSNQEKILVNLIKPGENLIQNGDFAMNKQSWTLQIQNKATVEWQIGDGISNIKISNGGSKKSDIQIYQNNVPLYSGQMYQIEFDAWASQPRTIEVYIGENSNNGTDYSQLGPIPLTRTRQHKVYSFEMKHPTNTDSRLMFKFGGNSAPVFIDNISLKMKVQTTIFNQQVQDGKNFCLSQNYPNPFNPSTSIHFELPVNTFVKLVIFNILGHEISALVNRELSAGEHSVKFDASGYSAGIYFYRLETPEWKITRKMLLVK